MQCNSNVEAEFIDQQIYRYYINFLKLIEKAFTRSSTTTYCLLVSSDIDIFSTSGRTRDFVRA